MGKQDVDKLVKLVKALDSLVELGEDIFADGKVDFADLTQLPRLAPLSQELYAVWSARAELLEEVKDLDFDEVIELVKAAK